MKDLIQIATEEFIDKWNNQQSKQIPYIHHKFDLKGRVAGQFWHHNIKCWFRWNLPLAIQNSDDFLINTVGHEVAHLITHHTYPRATSHGYEWKSVMVNLGLEPARCHSYKTTPARTVPRPFTYLCQCGDIHRITATKFKNFVMAGIKQGGQTNYRCNNCGTYININDIKPST